MHRDELKRLLGTYVRKVHAAEHYYSDILDNTGLGLEVIFDGVVRWSFRVKVRKPWNLFGVETEEEQQVFCRGMRTHVVTSHLAADLLSPIDGSLLSIEEEHVAYNDSISGPDQASWPRSVFDWEEDDGDSPDFLRTDSSSDNLKTLVAPDEDMVLVSRSIRGFEGQEETLSSIKRRKEAFLDGTVWPEDANFVGIELRGEPKVLFNGEGLHTEDRRWLLRRASRLLPTN